MNEALDKSWNKILWLIGALYFILFTDTLAFSAVIYQFSDYIYSQYENKYLLVQLGIDFLISLLLLYLSVKFKPDYIRIPTFLLSTYFLILTFPSVVIAIVVAGAGKY